jgi:hypothetical protein
VRNIPLHDTSEHEVPLWAILFNLAVLTALLYLTFYDFGYILACWLIAVPIVFGLIFIQWLGASIDSGINPWIEKLELNWWNMFTTKHYNAWLYFTDSKGWLSQQVLILPPISIFFVMIFFFRETAGALWMIGDFLLALLLLVLVHMRWKSIKLYFKHRSAKYSGEYIGD